MHPAYSVIFFTTSSGAGYGLLIWLCLAQLFGAWPNSWALGGVGLGLALVLITAGLLSSTLHLGRPERAVRAFSQWRSSWLSREGVLAVATYIPAGLLWLSAVFGIGAASRPFLALLAVLGALGTVWCTGMIYGSLRTIRQWNRADVPMIYLALAMATGALLALLTFALLAPSVPTWLIIAGLISLLAAAGLKWRYWQEIDRDQGQYTAEMATGLGDLGRVRPLDPPHTRPNFVMREMGYQVARKHAVKLRRLASLALFALPAVLSLLAIWFWPSALWLSLAVIAAAVGVFAERWLFFAEASHVSQLYYGTPRA